MHNATALPAVALARDCNISLSRIVGTFGTLRQASMRGQLLRFKEGFTVIDDSYNSNPRALMQMIELLSGIPSFTRRILIAGEMLELGRGADALHSQCGTFAAERKVDLVIGVRGLAREIVCGAAAAGMPVSQTHFFLDADSAAGFVKEEMRKGDLILIKGSRGVHLEKVIQKLRDQFELLDDSDQSPVASERILLATGD